MTTDKLIPEAEMQQMNQDAARVPAAQRIENFEQDGSQEAPAKSFHRLTGTLCVVLGLDYAFGAENRQSLSTVFIGGNAVETNAYAPFALARPDANLPTGLGRLALNRALDYLSDFNQNNEGALLLCNSSDLREFTEEAISGSVQRLQNVFEGVAVGGNLTDENITRADLLRFDYSLHFDPRMDENGAAGVFKHEVTLFLVVNCPNLYNAESPAKLIRQVQNSVQSAASKAGIECNFALMVPSPAALTADLFNNLSQEYGFTAESGKMQILQPVALRDVQRRGLNSEWLPADVEEFFADSDLMLVADETEDPVAEDDDVGEQAAPARQPVKTVKGVDEDDLEDDLLDVEANGDEGDDELEDDEDLDSADEEDEDVTVAGDDDIDSEDDGDEEEASIQFNLGMYIASVDLMRDLAQNETGAEKEEARADYQATRNEAITFIKENVREFYAMRDLFDLNSRELLKAIHKAADEKAVIAAGVAFIKFIIGDESIVQNMCEADEEFAAGYDAIMTDDGEEDAE